MRLCVPMSVLVMRYVARNIRFTDALGVLKAPSELGRRVGAMEPIGPYVSTSHDTRTLTISSTNSTAAVTRSMLSSSFVSVCAAVSFRYASSSSSYGRLLADADSLASSRSRPPGLCRLTRTTWRFVHQGALPMDAPTPGRL